MTVNFFQHPGKFRMHWLGPYEVNTVTDGGSVQLKDLGGTDPGGYRWPPTFSKWLKTSFLAILAIYYF
jgi:hypothetical protein